MSEQSTNDEALAIEVDRCRIAIAELGQLTGEWVARGMSREAVAVLLSAWAVECGIKLLPGVEFCRMWIDTIGRAGDGLAADRAAKAGEAAAA